MDFLTEDPGEEFSHVAPEELRTMSAERAEAVLEQLRKQIDDLHDDLETE